MDHAEQVALEEDAADARKLTSASREVWRPVPGLEGHYSVSSHGRVRSEQRTLQRKSGAHTRQQHILSPARGKTGYLSLRLGLCPATRKTVYVHALVLEAFVGPRPAGMDACHCDGNRSNNRLSNLRWDTRAANHADKHEHGTALVGSRHHMSKLTERDVLEIRRRRAAGASLTELSTAFNVGRMTIYRADVGINWSHLK